MASFAKEMQIRRRIESIYNKTRADFSDLREWGDYEEEREDIVFNLSQGIDVENVQKKVEAYEKAHSDSILRNQAVKANKQLKKSAASPRGLKVGATGAQDQSKDGSQAAADNNIYRPADITAQLQQVPVQLAKQQAVLDLHGERPRLSMEEIGAISGWTPELQYKRAREEACCSLFCF